LAEQACGRLAGLGYDNAHVLEGDGTLGGVWPGRDTSPSTADGDCPSMNAALQAVVRAAVHRHGIRVTGFLDGFAGLLFGSVAGARRRCLRFRRSWAGRHPVRV